MVYIDYPHVYNAYRSFHYVFEMIDVSRILSLASHMSVIITYRAKS